jgi:hypothetical protein
LVRLRASVRFDSADPSEMRLFEIFCESSYPDGANCARIERFQHIGVSLERKADSSICWKRYQLEVREGSVRVGFGARKAGAQRFTESHKEKRQLILNLELSHESHRGEMGLPFVPRDLGSKPTCSNFVPRLGQ